MCCQDHVVSASAKQPIISRSSEDHVIVGFRLGFTGDFFITGLDRDLRSELQLRVWQVAQAWKSGKSHLE